MFGFFPRRGANTNSLSPDHTTALFVTQAVASALASFGANELEAASQSLSLASESTLLIQDPSIRETVTALVQAAAETVLAIDLSSIAAAAAGEG